MVHLQNRKTIGYGLLLLLLTVGVAGGAFGQSLLDRNPGRIADQYFEAQQYFRATQYYEMALNQDSSDYDRAFRLAESYRHQFDYQQALAWYSLVYHRAERKYPEAGYYQAEMLKFLGRCSEAIPLYQDLLNRSSALPSDLADRLPKELQGCYEHQLQKTQLPSASLQKLDSPLNTTFHDYAPIIWASDTALVISSTRFAGKRKVSYRYGENNSNFFGFTVEDENWITTPVPVAGVNTKASEGAGCFVPQKDEFYFTSCPKNKPCEIRYTKKINGKWTNPRPLSESINLAGYHAKHPALTEAGDTLFFISDRPGGYGGTDVWMSQRVEQDQWAPPVCLDTLVNTVSDEVSPFYDSREHLLIYGSNGRGGLGGMDLYTVADPFSPHRRSRSQLAEPFNSSFDDGYLVLGKLRGYLASNRTGNFDIYLFQRDSTQSWSTYLQGIIPLDQRIATASVPIYHRQVVTSEFAVPGEVRDWIQVQSSTQKRLQSGATRFILNSDVSDIRFQQFQQQQRQESSLTEALITISSWVNQPEDSLFRLATFSTDSLPGGDYAFVTGNLVEGSQNRPLTKRKVRLIDSLGNLEKITTTNALGNFRFVNIQPARDYALEVVIDSLVDSLQVHDLQLDVFENELASQTFEPIFYDFNQDYLRPEARKVLESLAAVFKQHPSISMEINAFADSLGNDQYNLVLSQKRGEAAFRYLIEQGVDRAALAINAQGVSTAYTSTNSLVSQQLNRRVEFEIFGLDLPLESEVVTRILRPNVDIATLLQITGLNREALVELNGRPPESIQPYKPVRLPQELPTPSQSLFYQIKSIN